MTPEEKKLANKLVSVARLLINREWQQNNRIAFECGNCDCIQFDKTAAFSECEKCGVRIYPFVMEEIE